MKNFLTYLESKQDDNTDISFFEKRREGANKISIKSKKKGGAAMLTHWHFAAKDKQYQEVIIALKQNQSKTYYESKYKEKFEKLKSKLDQKSFQSISGELEVWGEALARLFK